MAKRCPQCAVDHNRSSLFCSSSCYNRSWYARNKQKIRLAAESQPGTQLLTEDEIKESLSLITELRDVVPGKLCGIARNTGIHRHALMRILAGDRDPVRVELMSLRALQQKYFGE